MPATTRTLPHDYRRRDVQATMNRNQAAIAEAQTNIATMQTEAGLTGTATINGGETSVTVTHNYGSTGYTAIVVPQGDLGSGRRFWVANKDANSFDIVLDAAVSPSAAKDFDWSLRGT